MTREVLARKLARMGKLVAALRIHAGKSAGQVADDPYEIERLLELLVQIGVDILSHQLAARGVVPESYRSVFLEAGEHGLLPPELATRLADAAGLRNVLVHMYDTIDYEIVAASIDRALVDFGAFIEAYRHVLEAEGEDE